MTFYQDKYRIESSRLKNWDYASAGWYFVTICTRDRECLLGEIIEGKMILSAMGEIAEQCWKDIPLHFENVKMDTYMIMPNHLHGIVVIQNEPTVETHGHASLPKQKQSLSYQTRFGPQRNNLSSIVRGFKSSATYRIRNAGYAFGWQPRFYDHVIRDEQSLNRIRQYILDNPVKWDTDREHVANLWF